MTIILLQCCLAIYQKYPKARQGQKMQAMRQKILDYPYIKKNTGSDTENNILAQNNDPPHFKRVPVIVIS